MFFQSIQAANAPKMNGRPEHGAMQGTRATGSLVSRAAPVAGTAPAEMPVMHTLAAGNCLRAQLTSMAPSNMATMLAWKNSDTVRIRNRSCPGGRLDPYLQ